MAFYLHCIFRCLVYANFWIALGASLGTWASYELFLAQVNWNWVALVFVATLCYYNFHRLMAIQESLPEHPSDLVLTWSLKNRNLIVVLTVISGVGTLFLLFTLSLKECALFAFAGFLTFLYSVPLFSSKGRRLRQVGWLKTLLVAFVWMMICAAIPLSDIHLETIHYLYLFEQFLFIFLITLPFDQKDEERDLQTGIRTLPQLIGKRNLQKLYLLCCLILITLALINYTIILSSIGIGLTLMLFYGLLHFILKEELRSSGPVYYYFILDGSIVLKGALLLYIC